MQYIKKVTAVAFLTFILVHLFTTVDANAASDEEQPVLDELYIEIGDALINAKDEEWQEVQKHMDAFSAKWKEKEHTENKASKKMTEQFNMVMDELQQSNKQKEQIRENLSLLSKSLVAYDKSLNPVDKELEKEKIKQLIPLTDKWKESVTNNDIEQAQSLYQQFVSNWNQNETIVRNQSVTAYGSIETQMAFIRIGLTQEPVDKQKALAGIEDLQTALNDFISGKTSEDSPKENVTLDDIIQLLDSSSEAINAKNANEATDELNQLLVIWPVVEGDVRTRDPKLYSDIENDIPKVIGTLQSKDKDFNNANETVIDLRDRLAIIGENTSYSYVDAMLILLREGLEAILIIAGLLAFLKKTNNEDKRTWIWLGAGVGLVASAALAIVINIFFSNITAASSREYLEGVVGLVAVVMMLTVGAWLHKKTNINHWNHLVNKNLSDALAKGSLISMAFLSFLSIFREGAETIIFYAGMAPSMKISQLILGIGIATAALVVLGFLMIRYSTKIPLRPFFFVATWLIYFLAFKMLGVSIHALQVSDSFSLHYVAAIPFVEWIGLYPTMETLIPQVFLLLVIVGTSLYNKKSGRTKAA